MVDPVAAADSASGVARIAVTVRNEGYYEADGRSRKNVQQSVLQWLLYVISVSTARIRAVVPGNGYSTHYQTMAPA